MEFHNNIVAFNGGWGVFLDVASASETLSYNNFHQNTSGNYGNTTVGANDVSLNPDPLFIDADTGNFALLSNSPSKDAGRIGAAFNDPDGTRSDIGAYSGSAAAAFWPYVDAGPVISEIMVTPASVPQGGNVTIEALGRVR